MIESYPLYWPDGWKRTPYSHRERSRFKTTFGAARDFLLEEIRRLGGIKVILSTNIPLRQDGLPYASAREPDDPGVAVYFSYQKKAMSFACDQYEYVRENAYSIGLTIEALRGIKRWGASDMMERAFRGFTALPEASWRTVLGVGLNAGPRDVDSAFNRLAHEHHPDKGGDALKFDAIVKAREQARRELGQ